MKSLQKLLRILLKLWSKLKKYAKIHAKKFKQCIAIILFCECVFYARHKYLEYYVNHHLPCDIQRPVYSQKKIEIVAQYCLQYDRYFDDSHSEWLAKRFNCSFKEIKKGNIRHLIEMSYFLQYDHKTKSIYRYDAKEIEFRENFISNYIKHFENMTHCKFEEGYNPSIETVYCIHPKQRIPIIFHPLTIYLAIAITKAYANCIFMFYLGFKYKYIKGLKVWYRLNDVRDTQNVDTRKPLIMFSGISAANPMQNIVWMSSLIQKYKRTKNLFLIETQWSEMSIVHFIPFCGYLNHKIPPKTEELVDIIVQLEHMIFMHNGNILKQSTLQLQWNLCGHSFGTFLCCAIYKKIKETELGVIPRLIFMDPAAFCVMDHKCNGLWGIVQPEFIERVFQLFVGQEIMIATTAARYFPWIEYCLFPHELINDGCNKSHIVITATMDRMIAVNAIKKGINEANKLCNNEENEIIHIVIENGRHGIILADRKYQEQIIDLL